MRLAIASGLLLLCAAVAACIVEVDEPAPATPEESVAPDLAAARRAGDDFLRELGLPEEFTAAEKGLPATPAPAALAPAPPEESVAPDLAAARRASDDFHRELGLPETFTAAEKGLPATPAPVAQ